MRILTIVLAALLALLPDCASCLLCGLEGGPCAAVTDRCCDGEGCPAPAKGASGDSPCTCGSACASGCLEPDPAPPAPAPAAFPPPAAADLTLVVPGDAAPPALPAPAPRTAGPPARLPLRI